MEENRTIKINRNIFFGIFKRVYFVITPFILRTALVYFLGLEYVGLNGLFASVLTILSLAELGAGSAMIFSLYKPIYEKNYVEISALIKLYKKYYRTIGSVIFLVGNLIIPFVPCLVHGEVPSDINVYYIYYISLLTTCFSYWLFAYKNTLLFAFQRDDILSKISIIVNTIQVVLQLAVLYFFKNYYLFLIISLICQIANSFSASIVSKKMFPSIIPKGIVSDEKKKDLWRTIKDLFTIKIGVVAMDSVDTIVISSFLGLNCLAIYQNYYLIICGVLGITNVIIQAILASLGEIVSVESKSYSLKRVETITFFNFIIITFCTSCLISCIQPFMLLWMGKDRILQDYYVIAFCMCFFLLEQSKFFGLIKDAAGSWHIDRFRPLIETVINIVLSIIAVNKIGMIGAVLATILVMFLIDLPWLLYNMSTQIFEFKQSIKYYMNLFKYNLVSIFSIFMIYELSKAFISMPVLKISIMIISSGVITLLMFIVIFRKKEPYKDAVNYIKVIKNHYIGKN